MTLELPMLGSFGPAVGAVLDAALAAVEPRSAVRRAVRCEAKALTFGGTTWRKQDRGRVRVVGGGKAAVSMAEGLVDVLGEHIDGGLVVTHLAEVGPVGPIEVVPGGHPVPSAAGVEATARLADSLSGLSPADLVVVLVSGGASSLLAWPAAPLSLPELQRTTELLLSSGAPIGALNAVRKHLSALAGGQLCRLAAPATVVALVLSDVIGNPLDVIGSGLTAPDPTTFIDALCAARGYGVQERLPAAVRERLERGAAGELEETPKRGDPLFAAVTNVIVGCNRTAAEAAVSAGTGLGFTSTLVTTELRGEARDAGARIARELQQAAATRVAGAAPMLLVYGGETTVTVRGRGHGGRNQELALAAAVALEGQERVAVLAFGTDGRDGPTDAAGAVATGASVAAAVAAGVNGRACLADNDAYRFFEASCGLLRTGPTGTNVADLVLALAW